ncbi:MAG: indolepyruvate ferredoxin oxidoreductase family protein, partial [Pseudomonadota bacterium]
MAPSSQAVRTVDTEYTLEDRYAREQGRIFLTGSQALVRLPMMQRQRDVRAGLNTGAYVTGYRGSPLAGIDQQFERAGRFLRNNHIVFQPGVNEDLAATAVWGSQQIGLSGDAKYDGVFSMWYGKGPGVDRSGDVFKHGNSAGTAKHGGVLLLAGDDHTCKSSTLAHQSEYAFMDASIPVLNPAGVQEFLDYGLHGWAMSRFAGVWVGFKCVADTVEASASCYVDPDRINTIIPADFEMPDGGLNIRWPDEPLDQEYRLHRYKLYAALAYARANKLDQIVIDSSKRRFGIVTTGKTYLDVRQALDDLGITEQVAEEIGLSVYKVGMSWPLERDGIRNFAEGLEEILVIEEKRALIENQMKEQLYSWRADVRPKVIGKFDESGAWILPSPSDLTPARIARVIADRIAGFHTSEEISNRLAFLDAKEQEMAREVLPVQRTPYFCSGCPHNTSTVVPDGSRALAGIGCHYMSIWMDRNTQTFSQMGGEGAAWNGQAPFVEADHVFANIGDGTYFHSGLLAIRAAVSAKVNITYKILFNDAVAMTGGQTVDGPLTVDQITRQVAAEGVGQIVVVTDEPDKYPLGADFAPGVTVHHRDDLDEVQRDLREISGVTVLVYDQTCASEKRRRRKRGQMVDPNKRVVINELVCEGCGDCSVQSNCVSVMPLETEFGRKRTIDQSSCNKDFSCVKGFCPSFVTVEGGKLRKPKAAPAAPIAAVSQGDAEDIPAPSSPSVDHEPYDIIVTGIGGTGVVTIGALLGMAAHLEGLGSSVMDITGLAQKGGSVLSHIRIAKSPEDIHAVSVAAGAARLVLGCDILVAASPTAVGKMSKNRTHVIANTHEQITGAFVKNPEFRLPSAEMRSVIQHAVGDRNAEFLDGTAVATGLMGDSIATNLFMLGYAYQKGLIPVSAAALERAIELNGVAVKANKAAFSWGRRAARDLTTVTALSRPQAKTADARTFSQSVEEVIERRIDHLTGYQNAAYAQRYSNFVKKVQEVETAK